MAGFLRVHAEEEVNACACGEEPPDATDERPHPSVDHLVNVYATDPSPEAWLRLENARRLARRDRMGLARGASE